MEISYRYTVVYEVELPGNVSTNDQLSIHMCSPGGYDQVSQCHLTELPSEMQLGRFTCPGGAASSGACCWNPWASWRAKPDECREAVAISKLPHWRLTQKHGPA